MSEEPPRKRHKVIASNLLILYVANNCKCSFNNKNCKFSTIEQYIKLKQFLP